MSLGPLEILAILIVALLVFGPKRLPEVGRQVGGALRELRRMQEQVRSELGSVLTIPTEETAPEPAASAPVADREPDHDEAPPPPDTPPGAEPPAAEPETETSPPAGFGGPPGSFV